MTRMVRTIELKESPPMPTRFHPLLSSLLCIVGLSACNADELQTEAEPLAQAHQAVVVTLQPGADGKDTRILSHPSYANQPWGDISVLLVMAWTYSGTPGISRTLIDFDIPPPPGGSVLTHATLVLSAETSDGGHSQLTGTNEMRVLQITSPWEENTATWNNQPGTDPSEVIALPASTSADQTYQIDVTHFIQRELASPSLYHGLMLQLQTEQYYRALRFVSSNHPNAQLRPKLVLDYSASAPPDVNRPPVARCRSVTVPSDAACGVSDSVNDGSYDLDAGDTFTCVQTPGGPYPVGSRWVTLTCTDAGGLSSSCEATVMTVGPGPLTLTLNGNSQMTLECGVDTWTDPGAQAWAACGPLEVHRYNSGSDSYGPGPDTSAEGTYSVQYIAWNAAGTTVSAIRSVTVQDSTRPALRLRGAAQVAHTCGSQWVDPGVESMDACYGDVSPTVRVTGQVNGWVPGTYTLLYEVTDSGGNSAPPVRRTVTVTNCPW
jgi:hypothetical protein